MFTIRIPQKWVIDENANTDIYIKDTLGLEVQRWTDYNTYTYSDNKKLAKALSSPKSITEEVFSINDIIENNIAPKLRQQGFSFTNKMPLDKINQNSIAFYNSTYSYPDKVETVLIEYTNHQNKKAFCILEYKIRNQLNIQQSELIEYDYVAEVLVVNNKNYDTFKNDYLYALTNLQWDKNYIQDLYNRAISEPQIRKNQMVVREEPLISYLDNIDWKNASRHAVWYDEQVCLGRKLERKYYYDDLAYSKLIY